MFRMAVLLTALWLPALAQGVSMNALEKEFQAAMTGVVMEGQSTRDGRDGVQADRYNIEKIEKTGEETWTFFVKVNMQGKEFTLPLPIDIKWAGDTPVVSITDKGLPGMGTYTARVVIYRGHYAGTWSGKNGGGKVFGQLTKSQAAPAASGGNCPLCPQPPPPK